MRERLNRSGIIALTGPFRWIIIAGLVFFIAAGDLRIPRAWIYIAAYCIGALVIGVLLWKRSPALLNDRGKMQEGTKKTDLFLVIAYFVFAIWISPLAAGLDHRWGVFPLPTVWLYLGLFLYIVASLCTTWPMLVNPFFEATVRIQKDKNHAVIQSGPYEFVRHPGYVGMLIGAFPLPLAFGSGLALVPALVMAVLVIFRTYFEDNTLRRELDGYADYCRQVKYRLIPFIW